MKYNEQQQLAIQAEGNAIVSAGAGCGKTSVLVGRCLEKSWMKIIWSAFRYLDDYLHEGCRRRDERPHPR